MAKSKIENLKRLDDHDLPDESDRLIKLFGRICANVIALLVVDYLIEGFTLETLGATLVAAIVLGVINMFVRPVVQIIALPLTVLTLGIFAFIVNVLLLMVAAEIVPGFEIDSFVTAAISSLLLALVNMFFHKLAK